MQRLTLGDSGIEVSEICLGTMTWGNQTAETDAHAQIDLARDHGIDFLDAAEMYPTNPVRAETVGHTEAIIGNWLRSRGGRGDIVIATKATGGGSPHVRDGAPVSAATLRAACEGSLRRLGVETIDLYQLHWPNRGSYHFRQNWTYDPSGQDRAATRAHIQEILTEAGRLRAEGKIRAFGLSNESAWGAAEWLRIAEAGGWPRPASIQNEYSLLCRAFDTDLAELSVNENLPLLAFSPLAAGLLTGKYAGDATPPGSRRAATPELGGRTTPRAHAAVAAYHAVAARHGLDPCGMAVAWCRTRPFCTIPIIGATTTGQLRHLLENMETPLSPEVLAEIDATHRAHPMPY
jgi:aryl-alcohol dehydrogenase-like predicted oxidoreductase